MAKRPAPPSASAPEPQAAPARTRVDVAGWLGGIRLSGFMVIMLALVVVAAFVLVPTLGNYIAQRQRIAALEQQVQLTQQEVDDLRAQRERLQDPAYLITQARERLYYVKPGEIIYIVDNDLPAAEQPQAGVEVSAEVTRTPSDWRSQFVSSLVQAGLARTVTAPVENPPADNPPADTPPSPSSAG